MLQGTIIKSTGSWYAVRDDEGRVHECRIKGKFRIQGFKTTNPLAVGDRVSFEPREGVIEELHERRNYIIRRATNQSRQAHILAANIDQGLLIVTLAQPRTSLGFIDRFLVTAEAYRIPAVLVFNKMDLLTEYGEAVLKDILDIYERLAYPCCCISALEGSGLQELRDILEGNVSLLAGHSGAGKSTLINRLIPGLNLKTGEISDFSGKGIHTTTFAEMFALPSVPPTADTEDAASVAASGGRPAGYIIDTPGIREFGIFNIAREELSHYFVEMRERFNQCRFDDCRHINEPGCAVIQAVEEGDIALSRYESYLSMYEGFDSRA